ncbi:hypothetical protein PV328_006429 [Microctonus aethiopoides]|uniref:U3 small nucleolar RNA-associated protein 14 homolog A n=1 Tax=Microctonus aethiopoides TaxID=144406 RepID=A0AA39FPA8_9HYME|nr:hypothetical protein PV328_006429 [Microctonus aethiopoides]
MDTEELNSYDDDNEISQKHSQLLQDIAKLDRGQKIKKPERSEPTLQVSEFHLVKSGIADNDAVCVDELVKTLRGKAHHKDINKKFNITKKQAAVLPKPLEKPAAEKVKRAVGFENTTKELAKWDAIITRNRIAPKQFFPLNQSSMRLKPTDEFVKRFRVLSDLEKELSALEPEKPNETIEKTDEFSLTLEEMKQKRLEAAKFRAQQSYKHAKAHRQKKIKSKKFHRIERNAKVKEQLKEFAKLQQTDPQAALEKLEQLSRARAEERMSLKHKNTSQWAKNKMIRAKYDKESREALAQQLSISRDLMQKVVEPDNSDEEINESDIEAAKISAATSSNPWINNGKTKTEIDEFVMNYRKYWDKKHKADFEKNSSEVVDKENENISCESQNKKNYQLSGNKIVGLTNPVVSVIEEENVNIEEQNEINKANKSSKKKNKRNVLSQSDNLKPVENKTANNEKKNKTSAPKKIVVKKKVGTSKWCVEPLEDKTQSANLNVKKTLAIDDMFDAIEDNMKQKVKNKLKRVKRKLSKTSIEKGESDDDDDDDAANHVSDLSFKRLKSRPDVDEPLNETARQDEQQDSLVRSNDGIDATNTLLKSIGASSEKSVAEIDPNNFINAKSQYLKNHVINNNKELNDDAASDDSNNDEEGEINIDQKNIISEAFADDDVVEDFKKEKAEEIEKSQLKDVDLRLPGWGAWGGKNVKQAIKKKRRFILKFPKSLPRNDENKGNVILIQDDLAIKKHQVNDVPYPFSSVSDFETSIRAPIGRNFIPENAHKRLTEPAVITKMGKVIEPMDEDVLVEKKKIKINEKLSRQSKNRVTKKK